MVGWTGGLIAAADGGDGFLDPDLVLWSFAVFILLLILLRRYAWGPICEALDRREETIREDLERARLSTEKAAQLQATYEAKLATAADEANQIVATAREEAAAAKARIIATAHQEAEAIKQRGLAEVEAARKAVVNDLARASVDSAVGLAGRLIHRSLDREAHAELISESLSKFDESR